MPDVEKRCEFCGRWLATLKADGLDLAGRAEFKGVGVAKPPVQVHARIGGQVAVPLKFVPDFEVKCLLWRCRLRRWMRSMRESSGLRPYLKGGGETDGTRDDT